MHNFNLILSSHFRSSSLSSSTSSKSSCSRSFFKFGNRIEEDFYSLSQKSPDNCLSNKENILHSNLEVGKKKLNLTAKMPPTSTKLPGRQTNNSLSSITGQIVIETPATVAGPSTSRKKKVKAEV